MKNKEQLRQAFANALEHLRNEKRITIAVIANQHNFDATQKQRFYNLSSDKKKTIPRANEIEFLKQHYPSIRHYFSEELKDKKSLFLEKMLQDYNELAVQLATNAELIEIKNQAISSLEHENRVLKEEIQELRIQLGK